MWMKSLEDTLTCKNNVSTLQVLSILISINGLLILALGILDVTTTTLSCTALSSMELSKVAVGVWGSPPIILTGMLAAYLIDNPNYTIKFLQILSLVSGMLFAPVVLIISALDASFSSVSCGSINNQVVSICLAAFGGCAFILIGILIYRLYCSHADGGDQETLVATKSNRVFAKQDEFMVTNLPAQPAVNNGSENPPAPPPTSVNQVMVPFTVIKKQALMTPQGQAGGPQMIAYNSPPQRQLVPLSQLQQQQLPYQQLPVQQPGQEAAANHKYFISIDGGEKINTNMYPQFLRLSS